MASTADFSTGVVQLIALEQIRHDSNIREHDNADVEALAGSIELLGQITPAIVRPDGNGYVLVAGHKRYAALQRLGRSEIRAEIRSAEAEQSERAAENIVRTQLNPYEEARAVQAMLAQGLSQDGAAQALGWSKARVSARMRLLQLPARAQEMVGAGTIALSAIDPLLAIGAVSPPLLDAVITYLADGNAWVAERLAREPGWVLDSALRHGDRTVFAEHLSHLDTSQIAQLRLGKKTDALVEEATRLHKQLDRYAYTASFRFGEKEIDQARAAGVLIEFERSAPIIVDRALYRELAKQTIRRTVEELAAKVTARDVERIASRRHTTTPEDPMAGAHREHQRRLRELAETAHGVNLDIGQGLMTGLSSVDPGDLTVARFFVYALLGSDHDSSPYAQAGERVAALAVSGIRLVMLPLTLVSNVKRCLERQFRMCKAVWNGRRRIPENTGQAVVRRVLNLARSMREPGAVQGSAFVAKHKPPPRHVNGLRVLAHVRPVS
jgi:ParB/RepB/Spo0J family partition protein